MNESILVSYWGGPKNDTTESVFYRMAAFRMRFHGHDNGAEGFHVYQQTEDRTMYQYVGFQRDDGRLWFCTPSNVITSVPCVGIFEPEIHLPLCGSANVTNDSS